MNSHKYGDCGLNDGFQVVDGKQETPKKNFQPIRVDNWGIFLLSRLQNYFTKKELCDLTLRFPAQNAQIKVQSPEKLCSFVLIT